MFIVLLRLCSNSIFASCACFQKPLVIHLFSKQINDKKPNSVFNASHFFVEWGYCLELVWYIIWRKVQILPFCSHFCMACSSHHPQHQPSLCQNFAALWYNAGVNTFFHHLFEEKLLDYHMQYNYFIDFTQP